MKPSIESIQRGTRRVLALLVLAALIATGVIACGRNPPEPGYKLKIVTTFYPLEYFATRVGGDRVKVGSLVKPGVEAHDFEPTATDLRTIANADVFVYNGLGFEPWVERTLASVPNDRRVDVRTAPMKLHGPEGNYEGPSDPHVWLSPLQVKVQALVAITEALTRADPQGKAVFEHNARGLADDLQSLHERYASTLERCKLRHFVTGHAAFGQMAEAYGLQQIEITGISQEEPDPAQLARIVRAVRESEVRYVLAEPGASPRISETLAKEVNAQVLILDPLESRPPRADADYLTVMGSNLEVLKKALDCDG